MTTSANTGGLAAGKGGKPQRGGLQCINIMTTVWSSQSEALHDGGRARSACALAQLAAALRYTHVLGGFTTIG